MRGFTAFVVDRDAAVRDSMRWLLDASGIEARTYATPLALLDGLRSSGRGRGCVIADARLPMIDGLELQSILQAMGCDWPVIITTGAGDVDEAVQALRNGAVDYIEKPMGATRLVDGVQRAARQARGPAPAKAGSDRLGRRTLRFNGDGQPMPERELPQKDSPMPSIANDALLS
jgi:FixJ family two-component response regulator